MVYSEYVQTNMSVAPTPDGGTRQQADQGAPQNSGTTQQSSGLSSNAAQSTSRSGDGSGTSSSSKPTPTVGQLVAGTGAFLFEGAVCAILGCGSANAVLGDSGDPGVDQMSEGEKALQTALFFGTAGAVAIVSKGLGAANRVLIRTPSQLAAKFKHAKDFGIAGNYSKANAAAFSRAINQHVNSPGVQAIQGTYHGQAVTHFLDPSSGLNVIADSANNFISGWTLNAAQLQNVLTHGGL